MGGTVKRSDWVGRIDGAGAGGRVARDDRGDLRCGLCAEARCPAPLGTAKSKQADHKDKRGRPQVLRHKAHRSTSSDKLGTAPPGRMSLTRCSSRTN
eukprot:3716786-Prymnesium_polylepis.1